MFKRVLFITYRKSITTSFYEDFNILGFASYLKCNDVKKEDKYKNDLASLLIRNGETIYGNAIIFKTYLPVDNENNLFVLNR